MKTAVVPTQTLPDFKKPTFSSLFQARIADGLDGPPYFFNTMTFRRQENVVLE